MVSAQAATSVQSFVAPDTVVEAIEQRHLLGDTAIYLAGGTDLGVIMRRHLVTPQHLIDLSRIEELRTLGRVDDVIVIGSAVTHRTIELSGLFAGHADALREACATVGSVQTRNVGTLGGNLCNASPAADTAPVLLALDAVVEIAGTEGRRLLPIDDFFAGYRQTALAPGEILTAIRVPVPDGPRGSAFLKLGRRKAMEISIASVAVRVDLTSDGMVAATGVGLGSVAATSLRSASAEQTLTGSPPAPETWDAAGHAAASDCSPIDDIRATGEYRAAMVSVLVSRAAEIAFHRARSNA
jgi:carbon-monoxide dehydrogenase medium subunit